MIENWIIAHWVVLGKIFGGITALWMGGWKIYKKAVRPAWNYGTDLNTIITDIKNMGVPLSKQMTGILEGQRTIREGMMFIERKQDTALDAAGLAFWISENGACTVASIELQITMGRSEQEIKGMSWATYILESDILEDYMKSVALLRYFDRKYTYIKNDGMFQKVHGRANHFKVGDSVRSFGWVEEIGEPFN